MKAICIAVIAAFILPGTASILHAASKETSAPEKTAAPDKAGGDIISEFKELAAKIRVKLSAGKDKEEDYKEELKEWDALIDKHKGEKTEELAGLMFNQVMFYTQVLNNSEKALEIVKRIKAELPDTEAGMNADRVTTMIVRQEEARKIQAALSKGADFPDFQEKDLDGKSLSVANYKGKIVLVDFWATWCVPCMQEMPNVVQTYNKYHEKGFEVVGIALERDPDKERLVNFLKNHKMEWPQYLGGAADEDKLGKKYGITTIPTNYLIGKDGKIIDKDLRGDELETAVEKSLSM